MSKPLRIDISDLPFRGQVDMKGHEFTVSGDMPAVSKREYRVLERCLCRSLEEEILQRKATIALVTVSERLSLLNELLCTFAATRYPVVARRGSKVDDIVVRGVWRRGGKGRGDDGSFASIEVGDTIDHLILHDRSRAPFATCNLEDLRKLQAADAKAHR